MEQYLFFYKIVTILIVLKYPLPDMSLSPYNFTIQAPEPSCLGRQSTWWWAVQRWHFKFVDATRRDNLFFADYRFYERCGLPYTSSTY
ncbi:hypothetical protein EVAR_24958_1 [Eumeta japonica]|uniref:Uncharacterized protein n=1 Tax=Eumeta variegata TaxID=151549 RepID=A0A4C1ZZ63_EUMVA|nr:hypothetical protein EVAR_24958_1 [Eumeta japonica]